MTAKELLDALERTGAKGAADGTNPYTLPVLELLKKNKDATADEALEVLREADRQPAKLGFYRITLARAEKVVGGTPEDQLVGTPPPLREGDALQKIADLMAKIHEKMSERSVERQGEADAAGIGVPQKPPGSHSHKAK